MGPFRLACWVGATLTLAACSSTENNNYYAPESGPAQDAGANKSGEEGDAEAYSDAGDGGGSTPEGGDGEVDAGVDSGPVTAFMGAPAFVGGLGPTSRSGSHYFADNNPAGQQCNGGGCHGSNAQAFLTSGTIWTSSAATTPVAGAEVVIRTPSGGHLIARTDGDGNYFIKPGAVTEIPVGSLAGIRTSSDSTVKPQALTAGQGNCMAGCHSSRPLHLP